MLFWVFGDCSSSPRKAPTTRITGERPELLARGVRRKPQIHSIRCPADPEKISDCLVQYGKELHRRGYHKFSEAIMNSPSSAKKQLGSLVDIILVQCFLRCPSFGEETVDSSVGLGVCLVAE